MTKSNTHGSLAGGIGAAALIVALFGFVGQMDYEAQREAECASYTQPRVWDKASDTCKPVNNPPQQQPEDYYRAAPKESHSVRH
jgi:hypothetical protein